ncbi:unnamed protein product [Durusdinium trenchii]|uniref:Tetratricopeptide repeat protein 28 n=1 Tax=Durusdinium trenchii TaxID=1381693 RepID=A0ABP0IBC5_9DINO
MPVTTVVSTSLRSPIDRSTQALEDETRPLATGEWCGEARQMRQMAQRGAPDGYSVQHWTKFRADAEELLYILRNQVPANGKEWSLHLLNKAYCSACRRYGSWDRLHLCLHDFLSLFPRTFELFGPRKQLVRPLQSSSAVADGEEEVMKRLALAKQQGVVHAMTPIASSSGAASDRRVRSVQTFSTPWRTPCTSQADASPNAPVRCPMPPDPPPPVPGAARPPPPSRRRGRPRRAPTRPFAVAPPPRPLGAPRGPAVQCFGPVDRPPPGRTRCMLAERTGQEKPLGVTELLDEAAAALRDVGDSKGEAFTLLHEVANAYLARKEVDSALNVASAGLRLLRQSEDLPGELAALKTTAEIHLSRGDTEPCLRLLQEVISLAHDSGDVLDEVDAHVTAARVRALRSEGEEALASVQAAGKAAAQASGDTAAEAKAKLGLAKVLQAKGDVAGAGEAARKAAALFKQKKFSSGELVALGLAWRCTPPAEATKAALEGSKALKASGDLEGAAEALLEATEFSLVERKADEAKELATGALQLFRELEHTKGEAKALQKLSAAEVARGKPSTSIKAAVDVVSLYQRRGDLRGQAEATCYLAKVYMDLGSLKDALSEVGEARLLFQKLKQPQLQEAQVLLDVAIPAQMALDDPPKAVAVAEDAANICRVLGDRVGEAAALKACAKVCVQKGDTKSALQASRQAASVLARARLVREEAEALHLTAKVHLLRLEPREAVSSSAQALTLLRRPGDEDERSAVLISASYGHSMALEYDGAIGTASEAVDLCRRTGNQQRQKMAMHALAEAHLIKGNYGEAVDTAEEALEGEVEEKLLEARLKEVSCYGRLGWSQSKKKGLRANPRDMLLKAKAASSILLATNNRRNEADAKFLLGKVQLKAGNVHAAINEVTKAYDCYGTLKDGQGVGWAGLLYAACLLRSPAKLVAGQESSVISKEIEVPQYDGALHSALVAHSTFRRIGDEEGTEAALQMVKEIRHRQEGSEGGLVKDTPRPRPLPPAFTSQQSSAMVNPYHELVGGRQIPQQISVIPLMGMPCTLPFPCPHLTPACVARCRVWDFLNVTGLAKARAALDLLELLGEKEATAVLGRPNDALLHGGLCLALAASGSFGEALRFYCQHSQEIADAPLKEALLQLWMEENRVRPGDLVQFPDGERQLVGEAIQLLDYGQWQVRVIGQARPQGLGGEAEMDHSESGDVRRVQELDLTLLSLRLSEEQRDSWRSIMELQPPLLEPRMSAGNEARWRRLFSAAAGMAASSQEDAGLPLEQSFIATVYQLILEHQRIHGEQAFLLLDILGCRSALELDDPLPKFTRLMQVLSSCKKLTVRMCGPEVPEDFDLLVNVDVEPGRRVKLELRRGLYHELYQSAEAADLVIAMNAGVGVIQYQGMWGPTLDLLASRPKGLLAITSYTAKELIDEEKILSERVASFRVKPATTHGSPTTLQTERTAMRLEGLEVELRRGDILQTEEDGTIQATCGDALIYVGPNLTPGRRRNMGMLVFQLGLPRTFQTGLPTPPPETVELEVVKSRPTPEIKQLEAPMEESSPKAKPIILRSALANLENWDHRFDRKAWHNVKATMSGLWEYPDMSRPESNVLMNAEFVNGWLEDLLAQGGLQ